MKYTLEFTLPGLPETTNQVLAMKLKDRMRQKKYWKHLVWMTCVRTRPTAPIKKSTLTLTRHSTTRPDPDGLVSCFKHIIDGLVLAKILEDDAHENIGFPNYQWAKAGMGKGFITVKVEEL